MILVLARNEETRKRAATRALFMINRLNEPKTIRFDLFVLSSDLFFIVETKKMMLTWWKLTIKLDYKFIHETFSMLVHGGEQAKHM